MPDLTVGHFFYLKNLYNNTRTVEQFSSVCHDKRNIPFRLSWVVSCFDRIGTLTSNVRQHFLSPQAGLLTLFPSCDSFPPKYIGAVDCCRKMKKGTHSCGTVGDSHSIPY